jgi:hypothetical protein
MHSSSSQPKKIDQEFLPALQKLIHEEYHYLTPVDPRSQKQRFYNTGELELEYPKARELSLAVQQTELEEMSKHVDDSTLPSAVKDLYQAKFSEQQKIIDILAATSQQDDEAFHAASSSLYGVPDPKLFWVVASQINTQFSSLIAKVDRKRKTLHRAYATWREYFQTLKQPENIGVYHLPMYNGIYVPHDYEVDSAEKIHRMFSDYLEEQNINNWVVQIDHPGARIAFGVNQSTKVISIPHDSDLSLRKRGLTKVSLKALLMHEVGVHVVRRENGDASPLALLGVGLDDYLRAEEGIATLAEQLITGTTQYSGEVGYFSIGAAIGTLGNPLSFSQLYTVLNAYYILSIADKQLETEGFYELDELRMTATDHAWNRALRVYRGSTGNTVGAVYTRDIIYLEGNRRMWKLLDSEAMIHPDWLLGKYDPTNPRHIAALKELEILKSS